MQRYFNAKFLHLIFIHKSTFRSRMSCT